MDDAEIEDLLKPVTSAADEWNESGEIVLAEIAEKSAAFRWLHHRAFCMFQRSDMRMALPIIVLSSLTGGVSLSLGSIVPEHNQNLAQTCVGVVNLFVGILGSVAQYYKFGPTSEAHRNASVAYSKLSRFLATQLALPPNQRLNGQATTLKDACDTLDNLVEQSPVIPEKACAQFREVFGARPPDVNNTFRRPEILGDLQRVKVFGRTSAPPTPQRRATGMWTRGLRSMGLGKKRKSPESESEVVVT